MKLLLVMTGGTIESKGNNSTIDVDDGIGKYLLKLYYDKNKNDIEFDVIQPINILSEMITPHYWKKLYDSIKQIDLNKYAGVIVTHGTDTLPYTSAFLSFMFSDTKIPFVIVGSNYTLDKKESNGFNNFCCAVNFIRNSPLRGIYSISQNKKGRNAVYLGTRIMEADSYNDQFFSYGGVDFGEMINGKLELYIDRINPGLNRIIESGRIAVRSSFSYEHWVYAIRSYPGLDYECLQFHRKPKAILHSLYHSGTGCIGDLGFSLSKFIRKCRSEGIDFYLISFKNKDQELYRTSKEILENGAIPLENISFEAALVKLSIAYNQTDLSAKEYMEKELFFEYLPIFS